MLISDDRSQGSSATRWLIASLSFLLFFPNPAWPVGNSAGIQLGQALCALALPALLFRGFPRRQIAAFSLLLLPLMASASTWLVFSGGASDMLMKGVSVQVFAMLPLVLAGAAMTRGLHRPMLAGASTAILVHAVLAFQQWFAFDRGEFPLLGLFQNPSFLQPTEDYARYVHRVTALFPEPSAMAASIGPWLVLLAALVLTAGAAGKFGTRRRGLFALIAASGITIILLSGTGYAMLLIGVLAILWTLGTLTSRSIGAPRKALSVVALLALAGLAVWVATGTLQQRVDSVDGLTWNGRLASLKLGISSLAAGPQTLLIGVGPGLSQTWLAKEGANELAFGKAAVAAIWSVQVRYICETGLLGALGVLGVLGLALASIARSSERLIGLCCLVAWIMASWLTTSYVDLEPMWLFLGVLLSWHAVFPAEMPAPVVELEDAYVAAQPGAVLA